MSKNADNYQELSRSYPFSPIRFLAALIIDFFDVIEIYFSESLKQIKLIFNIPGYIFVFKRIFNTGLSKQQDVQ